MFGFPLLLIPLAICNIVVFLMPGVGFDVVLARLTLPSLAVWSFSLGDALLAIGVLMLLLEVVKAARAGGKFITDHALSLLVFAGAAAEFAMLPGFGNSTILLLTVMALADFLAGISLRRRRRVVTTETAVVRARVEPQPIPQPAPVVREEPLPEPDRDTMLPGSPPPVRAPEPGPIGPDTLPPPSR